MQTRLFDEKKPEPITLTFKGLVPNFKNSKMIITKSPKGKLLDRPLIITKPEYQKVMAAMIDSFAAQLLSVFQTRGGGTLTAQQRRSLIALSMPSDDCWTQMPDTRVTAQLCEPGQEGVSITVEVM
jgi:hypothetical protein